MKKYLILLSLITVCGCSTVDNLPEWERLYTGIKKTEVHDQKKTYDESVALSEVKGALAFAPNNALFGSSSRRTPFPIGLWIHDNFEGQEKPSGFSKWLNRSFGSDYVTVNAVNPKVRTQVATHLLQNYGYFNGKVDYELIDQKNPKKQKIKYDIYLGEPYKYNKVDYTFSGLQDSIVQANFEKRFLKEGDQFNTANLEAERERLTEDMKDNGYYFFRDDYISYYADSARTPQQVDLLVGTTPDVPENAHKQMSIGTIKVYIRNLQNEERRVRNDSIIRNDSVREARRRQRMTFDDSITLGRVQFFYQGKKPPISTKVVRRNIRLRQGRLYQKSRVDETTRNLVNMQVFRNIQWTFTPRDTTAACDTLDASISLSMDKPIDLEAEFSFTQKSNDQVGPHGKVSVSKRNAFGHGETLKLDLIGSYEWQTRTAKRHGETPPDSYEAGLNASLTYPWLAAPWLSAKRFRFPTSTTFKAEIDHVNRAGFYRLLSFGLEAAYNFQTSRFSRHQFMPITLKYNHLLQTSEEFETLAMDHYNLYMHIDDIFIPAMQYTYTYDNASKKLSRVITHFDVTVKESANLLNSINAICGQKYNELEKKILGNPYSQFLKVQGQLINYFKLSENSTLATRLKAGVIWTYGNSDVAPFSEMFFVGGANSIRAFSSRSIGPGRFHLPAFNFLNRGDFMLEANAEYRFKLMSNLYGATFLDMGNVWALDEDYLWKECSITGSPFFKTLAVGTGVGLRYDLQFLVLRLDLGIGIHAPYDTSKSGYYNFEKFSDSLGLHFAIGYPF